MLMDTHGVLFMVLYKCNSKPINQPLVCSLHYENLFFLAHGQDSKLSDGMSK